MNDVYCSRGIYEAASKDPGFYSKVMECVLRHKRGDWGNVSPETAADNQSNRNWRLSAYEICGETIWITEEKGTITVLYPSEY